MTENNKDLFIEVAVALPIDRTLTYIVPDSLKKACCIGKRALVPVGGRKTTGYILDAGIRPEITSIKPVLDILDDEPVFTEEMVPLFRWISNYYLYPVGEVIRTALPAGTGFDDRIVLNLTPLGQSLLERGQIGGAEKQVLERIKSEGGWEKEGAGERKWINESMVPSLIERGLLEKKRSFSGSGPRRQTVAYVYRKKSPENGEQGKKNLTSQGKRVLDLIQNQGDLPRGEILKRLGVSSSVLKTLEKHDWIGIYDRQVFRDPFGEAVTPDRPRKANPEQEEIIRKMTSLLDGGFCVHLLFGVTGSGKTEVYLQIAENVLQTGKNVLILVPEISLISQMERRFRARFGDCVAIYHSGLSAGERYDQWVQVLEKRKTIMVGTRSAVFMPFTDLGMIIVDEEHDGSYKQESGLRYNARDVAAVRGKFADVPVLLGSATPSVQSYHNVKTGKYGRLLLNQRIDERPLARVVVEDLKELEHEKGIRRFLSPRLIKAIRDNLDRKEQTLIFINRRGYASFALCVICGEPVRCNHCDICLTVHLKDKSLICHYCGFMKPVKSTCAVCGSSNIVHMGLGTEKVEEMMRNLFPGARVQRMDRDTTRKKNSVLSVLKGLREKSIDILVGTQMVAKGHDFPNITLVGIICADFSLNFPDFRAGERTFQLLAQVAGRAGRGDLPGKVILQTFNPRHFSIETAKNQDYGSFYEKEIGFRSMLGYPPYSRLALLRFTGKNRKQTMETAKMVTEKLQAALQSDNDLKQNIALLGPVESPVSKIADRYRWQLLIKADSSARRNRFIKSFWKKNDTLMKNKHVRMVLDIDPYNV